MRILGVDPGLRITGYGVVSVDASSAARERFEGIELIEAGVIRPKTTAGIASRLHKIHDGLSELIDERRPDVLVIEKLYTHYKHPATAILMGHVRGVVCLLSAKHALPMISLASTHVKKSVTGHGHANKGQVQRMIQHYLGLKSAPEPADVADALAIAISYVFSLKRDKKGPVLASFPQIPPSKLRRVAVASVATFGAVPAGRQGNRAAYLIPDKRIRG